MMTATDEKFALPELWVCMVCGHTLTDEESPERVCPVCGSGDVLESHDAEEAWR